MNRSMHPRRAAPSLRIALASLALLLAGCALGPDYERPEVTVPAEFKHMQGWVPAQSMQPMTDDRWWTRYGDPLLQALVAEVDVSNQNIAQAEARYRQALALIEGSRAGLFPNAGADAAVTRSGGGNGGRSGAAVGGGGPENRYNAGLSVSWMPDLWGRVRRQIEASRADAQASAADLAAARLAAQSTLAQAYFRVRVLDRQKTLLEQTQQAFQRSLDLTRNQYQAGLVSKSDVVLAQTQLAQVQVQLRDLDWQRAQQENAIAVLTGRAPADFALAPTSQMPQLPPVPQAVPSIVLQRRPDVAAAERAVAAANARIGVAQTAWFPDLTLSASGGYQGGSFANWISAPFRYWSLGPALALTLFDGGARAAERERAMAAYDEQVARYRQTVLGAFQETEDALALLRVLESEVQAQREVVALAEENENLVTNRYRAGMVSYLEVAVAQNTTLSARRTLLDLEGSRLQASVQLMAALGGGWDGNLQPAAKASPPEGEGTPAQPASSG